MAHTRSILITMTDVQWSALISSLTASQSSDAVTKAAEKAFVAQIALEAVRAPRNGAERRA
jgi:hypothetical protein